MACKHECPEHPRRLKKTRKANTARKVAGMYYCPWCDHPVRVGYSWVCPTCGRSGTKFEGR